MPFHTQGASIVELHWIEELVRAEAAGGQVAQHLAAQCQDQQLQNLLQNQIRRTQQNINRLLSVVENQTAQGAGAAFGGYQTGAGTFQAGGGAYQGAGGTQGYYGAAGQEGGDRGRNWTT